MNSGDSTSLAETDRDSRIYGYKRVGFTIVVLLILNGITLLLPLDWRVGVYACGVLYAVVGVWSIRPGPCTVCGKRTPMSVPREIPYVRPAWWDLRISHRSRGIHVCVDHFQQFIFARVNTMMLEQVQVEMLEEIRRQEQLRATED